MKHARMKRIISFLMAFAMLLSLMPTVAFAAETPDTLYLMPNSNWTQGNARFAAYFFGNGEKWVSMTDTNEDGIYEVEVPAGYPSLIFCRMNPSATANNWNNKWDQTPDLTVPTDGTNLYTVKEDTWDKGGGSWSTYTPKTYTVYFINSAGWDEVCAYAWTDGGAGLEWPGVAMTKTGNTVNGFDIYSITFDTAYEKVIFNNNNQGSQTADLTLNAGQYYDFKSVAWYETLADVPEIDVLATDAYLVGSFNAWNTSANEFKLPEVGATAGAVSLELEANTDYEFKVIQSGAWLGNGGTITESISGWVFGSSIGSNCKLTTAEAGTYVFTWDTTDKKLSVTYPQAEPEPDPDPEPETITVYFQNNWKWTDVKVYYWGSTTGTNPEWPGVAMEVVGQDGGCDVYAAEIPADVTGLIINGTKDDGSGATDKTPDITTGISDGKGWKMGWSDGNVAESYVYNPTSEEPEPANEYYLVGYINNADYNGNDYKFIDGQLTVTFANDSYVAVKETSGDWYLAEKYCTDTTVTLDKSNTEKMFAPAGKELTFTLVENEDGTLTLSYTATEGGEVEPVENVPYQVTFHFANNKGWGNVYLYTWVGSTNPTGSWPGSGVAQDSDGFYTMTVEYEAPANQSLGFIFNNGGDSGKTVDLSLAADAFTETDGVYTAEKWIRISGEQDGTYTADILDEAFRIVTSPVVDGSSVTFYYENGNADSVQVAGTMSDWDSVEMKKDADGIWTATFTDLEPGVHQYKFIVGEDWLADPSNSWTEGENANSAFLILDPNAKDENKLTVRIHYSRADGEYDGWNFHLWNENGDIKDTSKLTEDGLVAELFFTDARSVKSVSVIPRFSTADNKWAAQEATFSIDLSNVVSGTVDYYITSGSKTGLRVLGTDAVLGNKLAGVALDYDTGKIGVTMANPVSNAQFGITDGDDANTYTLYFQNNWGWSDVRIYFWGSAANNPSWPGNVMTKAGNDGYYDIYMAQIPNDVDGVIINGIKDDGSGSRDQTPNITSDFADGLCYSMNWDNGNAVESFQYAQPISVTNITGSGKNYTLTLSKELDLTTLYQYKITFEGYEYAIDMTPAYASKKFAEEFTYDDELGAIWSATSTTFTVWAPTAESVSLNLYPDGTVPAKDEASDLSRTVEMAKGTNGVWTVTVAGNLNGTYYTYSVDRNGETVEAVDPYARTTGVNGTRGMVINLDSTAPKDGWSEISKKPEFYTDAIIYELHVRDFSIDDSSGVSEENRGKFLAFTEENSTAMQHLTGLGITHVHLLPIYDYASVDETKCENFNWGYDPQNYNAPEGSYSTDPYNGEVRVQELKELVDTLHENNIGVIMDVVYNHVYDAGSFCFNQIVPGYFSRPNSNASGCGNDTASEREMVRKYIVESVVYWAEEYHLDGFRFDLVGLLDVETINEIVTEVHKIREDILFYGEGWNMDSTNREPGTEMAKQGNADKTPGFGYFSDSIRNQIAGSNGSSKGFVSGGGMGNLANFYLAQPESWGETWTYDPTQVVQYASCHDNYTLIDKLVLSTGASGLTDDIIKMNNLSAAIYMTSAGIPFIHAGEEFLREKLEEDGGRCENSYNASDYVNHIEWSNLNKDAYADNVEYYRGLIAFRKAHAALRMNSAEAVAANIQAVKISDDVLAFLFDGNATEDDDILVIFNAGGDTVVTLPEGIWNVCVDGIEAGTDTLYTAQTAVQVEGISAMILTREDKGANGDEIIQADEDKYQYGTYEKTADNNPDTMTLYFSVNKGWNTVYAYAWGGTTSMTWPGEEMTYVETNDYGEKIYSITVSADTTSIIFNNGSEQTVDITDLKDGRGYYCTEKGGSASFKNDGKYEGEAQYYLFGYINGVDYASEGNSDAMGKYQFVNDQLTVCFETDSYVGVKTTDDTWYMTDGWLGNVTSATLKDTKKHTLTGEKWDKLLVPGGVEVTFTLNKNSDNTVTLSYAADRIGFEDASGVQDGVTLHCWNWSFDAITENMATIAEMGYTAIQTSPIQPLKEATNGTDNSVGSHWWVYYQPVDFVITTDEGNALGTKTDFAEMCAEAEKYGIQVIVDVVANHLGNAKGNDLAEAIPEYLRKDAYWHDIKTNITNYNDRYDMTQHCMSGLPDLNTSNKEIQGYVLDFLKECVDAGADGFRFDAAKHIETPADDISFASDFWPTVIGGIQEYAGNDLYIYGEVLDGTTGYAISDYTQYMSVTDNSWGNTLRSNVATGTAALAAGYDKAADASNLVLWAESHDTYATDDQAQSSAGVSVANINKTWALVAARADAMGLYFARPTSNDQALGLASATGWDNPEVQAVNRFHNAFAGQGETVGNSGDISYVVRGDSGIVLVNVSGTTASVEITVPMADGTYTDQITGEKFTVSDGKITGTIGESGIAVVYEKNTDLFKLDGATMTLGNSLDINFFIKPSDLDANESYYAVITKTYADGRDDVVVTVPQADWQWHEGYGQYYVTFDGVAAKEMCDDLTVVVYSKGEAVSQVWTDSVRDYTMRVMKNEVQKKASDDQKMALYVEMLNYGAAAQIEFDYNTSDLANKLLTDEQKAYALQDNVAMEDKRVKGEGYSATNLTLESNITMNFFFLNTVIPSNHDDFYAIATFTDHYGDEQKVRIEGEDFRQLKNDTDWYVPVTGLVVADCRQLVTVKVYNAEDAEVASAVDSIESYVARNVNKKDIYLAILKFGIAAYESFH